MLIGTDLIAQKTSRYLDSLLRASLPKYNSVFNNSKYKLQVIYTQITRNASNAPSFRTFYWHADSMQFFYPASLVKLPVSIAAMEKINGLKEKGVDRNTTMITDSAFYCQKRVARDTTAENHQPSLAHYIKKMFLVSDNYSCARVYEFAGCDYLHERFARWGFPNIHIVNRLDAQCKGDTGKITSPVRFLSSGGEELYSQPLTFAKYSEPYPLPQAKAGKAHTDDNGKRISGPKDFSRHNFLSLANCHEVFRRLVFWNHLKGKERYEISPDDWQFMMRYLGMYPRESDFPKYSDHKMFYDSFKKYFVYGAAVPVINSDSIRVFNIVGRAYGFLSDVAYIVDYRNNIEFLVSATIYVNERNIVGTGKYEYEQIALPLFRDISKVLYEQERKRKRTHEPDLSEFQLFGK